MDAKTEFKKARQFYRKLAKAFPELSIMKSIRGVISISGVNPKMALVAVLTSQGYDTLLDPALCIDTPRRIFGPCKLPK